MSEYKIGDKLYWSDRSGFYCILQITHVSSNGYYFKYLKSTDEKIVLDYIWGPYTLDKSHVLLTPLLEELL